MNFYAGKRLIREDRWFKYYEMEPNVRARVSKFATHEVSIRATEVRKEWDSWGEGARIGFAHAFSMKPEITAEDEEILEFMMLSTDERVLATIARCLPRHSNKEIVLRFLIDRLSTGSEPKANFLAGLGILADGNAVRPVKALHDRLAVEINRDGSSAGEEMVRDFLVSCVVLNKLEVSTSHRSEIESFLHDHRESIRGFAKLCLEGSLPI